MPEPIMVLENIPDTAHEEEGLEGQDGAPALIADPVEIFTPEPEIRVLEETRTQPVASASGADARTGMTQEHNVGTAGGGDGKGAGTGQNGFGGGSGASGSGNGATSKPKRISGEIYPKDYPKSLSKQKQGGRVIAHFDISVQGRITACRIAQSSGFPELDNITCKLAMERFRYEPARNNQGAPIAGQAGLQQDWWLERYR